MATMDRHQRSRSLGSRGQVCERGLLCSCWCLKVPRISREHGQDRVCPRTVLFLSPLFSFVVIPAWCLVTCVCRGLKIPLCLLELEASVTKCIACIALH